MSRFVYATRRVGAGTAIKWAIATATKPLPLKVRRKIHRCTGCAKRAAALDKAMPNINPLAREQT